MQLWVLSCQYVQRMKALIPAVKQWVSTFFAQEWREVQGETKRDETRDGKDIRSRLSRASSYFHLLAYCQSDHKQMGVTWAGNKLLIDNNLNEGKCTDVTLLCPASTYFPTPLLSPQFRVFCKSFIVPMLDLKLARCHKVYSLYQQALLDQYSSQGVYTFCDVLCCMPALRRKGTRKYWIFYLNQMVLIQNRTFICALIVYRLPSWVSLQSMQEMLHLKSRAVQSSLAVHILLPMRLSLSVHDVNGGM